MYTAIAGDTCDLSDKKEKKTPNFYNLLAPLCSYFYTKHRRGILRDLLRTDRLRCIRVDMETDNVITTISKSVM